MFQDLDKFNSIGWDFDETLVGHANSYKIQEYIRENPKKKHYIITFRTHGYQYQVFDDLAMYPHAPKPQAFVDVINIDDDLWEDYEHERVLRLHKVKFGPPSEVEIQYLTWKGYACKAHNIPVLVDDRKAEVILGCQKYGIVYMHPNDLYM